MPDLIKWLAPFCFGIVIGWIVYRTLRRSQTNGVSDLATVIGAIGGASVTALFSKESGDFQLYCLGLFVGFFGYLLTALVLSKSPVNAWLGHEVGDGEAIAPVFPKPK